MSTLSRNFKWQIVEFRTVGQIKSLIYMKGVTLSYGHVLISFWNFLCQSINLITDGFANIESDYQLKSYNLNSIQTSFYNL